MLYNELRDKLENISRLDALQQTNLMDSPPDESFDRLTRLATQLINTPIAIVSLVDDRRQFFKSCMGLPNVRETPLSHSFCQHVVQSGMPLIVADAREHPILQSNLAIKDLGVIAYAGIPIRTSDGYVLGSFGVIDTQPRVWAAEEIEILTVLAASVITEIELGSRVRAAEVARAQARRAEVEIATRIQQNLLYFKPPVTLCGFGIGTMAQASQSIDGDYFDFFNCDMSHFDFVIGDVMGKGAPAALLGAASKNQFQRAIRRLQLLLWEFGRPPRPNEILTAVHATMTPELFRFDSFITLCYARFDPHNHCVTLIDCGHTRTLHYHARTGSCSFLQGENLPLGVQKEEAFHSVCIPIELGDVLLFYSDGVTEAQNAQGDLLGEEGLLSLFREATMRSPQELVEHIHAGACAFAGSDRFRDDFTCVAFRFDEEPEPPPVLRVAREFNSSLEELERIGEFLHEFCQTMIPQPLDDETTHLIMLGVHEAVTNIIRHAYQERSGESLQIVAEYRPASVTFHLHDSGVSFDPTQVAEPDFEGGHDHGFGMFITRECMDEVSYSRNDLGRNSLTLVRKLGSRE